MSTEEKERNSIFNVRNFAFAATAIAAAATAVRRRVRSTRLQQHIQSKIPLQKGKPASVVRPSQSVESMYFHMWDKKLARPEMGQIYMLKGPKNTPQLAAKALANIRSVQPTMQMGAHKFDGKWFFHRFTDSDTRLDIKIMEGDRIAFESEVEKYLNEMKRPNQEDLLWRALIVTDKQREEHYLVWWAFHAITDGFSRMNFSRDLLHELDRLNRLGDNAPPLTQLTKSDTIAAPSLYERLESFQEWKSIPKWRMWMPRALDAIVGNVTSPNRGVLPIEKAVPASERRSRVVFRTGEAGLMKRFHLLCKDQGLSVTAGLIGVYMAQMRDHYRLPTGTELKFFLPINLRDRVASKLPEDELYYGCGIHTPLMKIQIEGAGTDGIWAIARQVQSTYLSEKSLRMGIVESELFVQSATALFESAPDQAFEVLLKNPEERALIGFSNSGVFAGDKFPRKVGEFSIEEIGSCFPTGPVTGVPSLFCYTFHDKAFLSLTYSDPLFSEATATKLLDGLIGTVRELVSQKGR